MRLLLVSTVLLASAGFAQAAQLPCSTNPGPNCYNDLRPNDKLAACERNKDQSKLKCYQKSSAPERQACIKTADEQHKACVSNATR
jgi:hypothetical protein